MTTLLIANRGEIALRVIRTAAELGLDTVAVYADDDADSPHVRAATRAVPLAGGYLDQGELLSVAAAEGADLLHPGYGFLSESAEFAAACADAGITFVGPSPEVLSQLGDKSAARAMARAAGLPVPAATEGASDLAMIRAFAAGQEGGIMIKALAGGGGRGMRVVLPGADVAEGYRECAAEALQGFGDDALFAEALVTDARHIEVQIVGAGAVVALGDRDCSVQRRHQKLIEVAPAQDLPPVLRRELHAAAATLGAAVGYRGIGTVEFLVAGDSFTFLEVNPRIQVEHTITEEVTGVDLVGTQLAIALGAELDGLGLPAGVTARPGAPAEGQPATAHGIAIQARVNMETMGADGSALPTVGTLTTFSPPTGPGVRVDTFGVLGLRTSARYDSLLAKVVSHVRTPSFSAAVRKAQAALGEFAIDGVATNIGFLQSILAETEFQSGPVHTSYVAVKMPILDTTPPPVAVGAEMRLNDGENLILAPLTGVVV